jgi:phage replication O-like protein O
MGNELKLNFTPVPNVILDEIMRTLASGAIKVLFAICRFTYGWGKQSDRISLNHLAEITGLERSNVHRAVKQLGHLVVVTPGDSRRNQASEYRLNVEISDTDLLSLRQQPVVRPVVTSATIQRKPKKIIHTAGNSQKIQPPDDPEFERAWNLYPRRAGDNPKERARAAWRARVREGMDPADMIAGLERYAAYVRAVGSEGTQYVKQAATFFGPDKHWRDDWALPRSGIERQRSARGFVV